MTFPPSIRLLRPMAGLALATSFFVACTSRGNADNGSSTGGENGSGGSANGGSGTGGGGVSGRGGVTTFVGTP